MRIGEKRKKNGSNYGIHNIRGSYMTYVELRTEQAESSWWAEEIAEDARKSGKLIV
jgi:hypothetical protein